MNREIKFKIYWLLYPRTEIVTLKEIVEDKSGVYSNISNNNIKVVQYTGLKDCNGMEIYEGDVLNSPGGFPTPADTIVRFVEGKFVASKGIHTVSAAVFKEMVISGNIYENPELLEKK